MALSVTLRRRALAITQAQAAVSPATATIWAAGILIRLLLMPYTAHIDLYQIYSRAADAVYHGQWFVWGSQIVIQMVHNVWLFLIRPLLPGAESIWSPTAATMGIGAQASDLARFLAYPYLGRALFLMKLPYFAADLGTGYALTRLVGPERRPRVLVIWLLNPLVIFASAVFGRHDSIAVLLVVVSVLAARHGRRYLGLALLGLGALARFFPAFLAPFFVVAYRRSRRELLALVGLLGGLWLVAEISVWTATGSSPTLTLLNRYPHVEFLVALALPIGSSVAIYVFPAVYALFLLWFIERHPAGSADFVAAGAALFQGFFALTYFHPQYTVWLVPFLALTIDRDARLIGYHVLQVLLLGVYTLMWGTGTTWDLLAPLRSPAISALPDPLTIIGAAVSTDLFFGVVRSLFAAVSLWLGYRILRDRFSGRGPVAAAAADWRLADGEE